MASALELDKDRQTAARVAARADIRDIRLSKVNAELLMPPDLEKVSLTYRFTADAEVTRHEELFGVTGHYRVEIAGTPRDPEDSETDWDSLIADIRFHLEALFTLEQRDGEDEISDEEIEAYARSTASFAMYPYAREFVSVLTARLALPQLTMGVLRFDLTAPEEVHQESTD